jgi:hypothetical protein
VTDQDPDVGGAADFASLFGRQPGEQLATEPEPEAVAPEPSAQLTDAEQAAKACWATPSPPSF